MDLLYYFKRSIVEKAIKYGLMLSPEVLDALLHYKGDLDLLFKELSSRGITTVELSHIQGPKKENRTVRREEKSELEEGDHTCEPKIRISLYVDPDELEPPNWEKERMKMLQERLEFLRPLITSRGLITADFDRAVRSEEERIVTGIILKKEVNGQRTSVYIEDGEESAILLSHGGEMEHLLKYVDQDMAVGFVVRSTGKSLVIKDVLWPQLASRKVRLDCSFKLLVIPEAYKYDIERLLQEPHDIVVFLSNVADVYKTDPEEVYRKIDAVLSSREEPIFIIPGPGDFVRAVPPHPPHDSSLFPDSASLDNVHLLGSPAIIKVDGISILLYDGGYYKRTNIPPEVILYSRLVQPNISSYPYRSSRDYSLLRRMPDYVLTPVGGRRKQIGSSVLIPREKPYLLDISTGRVKSLG